MSGWSAQQRPVWRYTNQVNTHGLDSELKSWLIHTDSLTRRLRETCGKQFRVSVLKQAWQRPQLGEAVMLDAPQAQLSFVREVYLRCGSVPWIFAHTVIPHRAALGALRRLTHMGNRPLGEVLFSDPSVRRGPLQIARIDPGSLLYARAEAGADFEKKPIWGRRSVFYLYNQPLLVSEIFLPALGQIQNRL